MTKEIRKWSLLTEKSEMLLFYVVFSHFIALVLIPAYKLLILKAPYLGWNQGGYLILVAIFIVSSMGVFGIPRTYRYLVQNNLAPYSRKKELYFKCMPWIFVAIDLAVIILI